MTGPETDKGMDRNRRKMKNNATLSESVIWGRQGQISSVPLSPHGTHHARPYSIYQPRQQTRSDFVSPAQPSGHTPCQAPLNLSAQRADKVRFHQSRSAPMAHTMPDPTQSISPDSRQGQISSVPLSPQGTHHARPHSIYQPRQQTRSDFVSPAQPSGHTPCQAPLNLSAHNSRQGQISSVTRHTPCQAPLTLSAITADKVRFHLSLGTQYPRPHSLYQP